MTNTELADLNEPDDGIAPHSVDLRAGAALSGWLRDHPLVEQELAEAGQARIHLQELDVRAQAAEAAATAAGRQAASTAVKLDPSGHRVLHPGVGAALVAALVVLDILPLNWAAQAFGLDTSGSWLITVILLAASIAAMAALEMTRENKRRRAWLAAGLTIACLVVVALRTEFLVVVAAARLTDALLQSVLLTALSVCLIMSGSVVLGRTRFLRLARARAAARRSRREAAATDAARRLAAERMQRHFGALRQMLIPWALSSPVPAGIDHVSWTAALERAIRGLFAGL